MYPIRTINSDCARLNGDRERNSTASCDPRDEREHNSEDDEHDDGAGDVEAFVAQKKAKAQRIKKQTADQNQISRERSGADRTYSAFLLVGCNETSPWIQMKKNRGARDAQTLISEKIFE